MPVGKRPLPLQYAIVALVLQLLLGGCNTYTSLVDEETEARPSVYTDPSAPGPVAGVGMESQDIVSMADMMARDILATPVIAGRHKAPRVVIDSSYFTNESSSRIERNIITDRLRVLLNRSAAGRIRFVGRQKVVEMVEKERALKRLGITDGGSAGLAKAPMGADFRLAGNITSLDAVQRESGMASRFHQITFEMYDLESGELVWSNMYEFKKSAKDDVIYR